MASREIIPQTTWYFSAAGNDNNDGLTNSTPKTGEGLFDWVAKYDLLNQNITFQCAAPSISIPPIGISKLPIGGGSIVVRGASSISGAADYVIRATAGDTSAFRTPNVPGPIIMIEGFEVRSAGKHGLQFGHTGGEGQFKNLIFGACSGAQVLSDYLGVYVTTNGQCRISGDAECWWYADYGRGYPQIGNECRFVANVGMQYFTRSGFRGFLDVKHLNVVMAPGIDPPAVPCTRVDGAADVIGEGMGNPFVQGMLPAIKNTGGNYWN